jgi:hypothetical protein
MRHSIKVGYKLTTAENFKCHICDCLINGKEGYIRIPLSYSRSYNSENAVFKICMNCWDNMCKQTEEKRKTRVEDYKLMLRKRMIMGLR